MKRSDQRFRIHPGIAKNAAKIRCVCTCGYCDIYSAIPIPSCVGHDVKCLLSFFGQVQLGVPLGTCGRITFLKTISLHSGNVMRLFCWNVNSLVGSIPLVTSRKREPCCSCS